MTFDPELDLEIERIMAATPAQIWRCWAEPALFKRWFVPPPVEVLDCENVLQPGGRAYVNMKLPDGTEMPSEGCFLHVEHQRRLVYTDGHGPGFRPLGEAFMTADVTLTEVNSGTRYHAHVMHTTPEQRRQHEEMGFHDGWGTTLDQLGALAPTL